MLLRAGQHVDLTPLIDVHPADGASPFTVEHIGLSRALCWNVDVLASCSFPWHAAATNETEDDTEEWGEGDEQKEHDEEELSEESDGKVHGQGYDYVHRHVDSDEHVE